MLWLIFICFPIVLIQAQLTYHQNDYTVKIDRVILADYNRSYIRNFTLNYVHYNRTYRALNGSGRLLHDLRSNIKLTLQLYKFLSNEYRFFPLTMEIDGCKELVRDSFGVRQSYQKSVNLELRCPFKKGSYKMTYGSIDFAKFPPYMPAGEYKAEIKCYYNSNFLFEIDYYTKVDEIIKNGNTKSLKNYPHNNCSLLIYQFIFNNEHSY